MRPLRFASRLPALPRAMAMVLCTGWMAGQMWVAPVSAAPVPGDAFANAGRAAVMQPGSAAPARASSPAAMPAQAQLAWWRDGQWHLRGLKPAAASASTFTAGGATWISANQQAPADFKVPLGSVWKLLVYAYLVEAPGKEAPYHCSGKSTNEDSYCCEPGGSIGRDAALARSCAAYFAPARLGLTQQAWQSWWQPQLETAMPGKAEWLLDLKNLQPGHEVPLAELLQVLAMLPPAVRQEARRALLATGVEGYGRDAWRVLGSGIRYKTWSWHRADGSPFGGAAGWLADGTPFWFGARGASRSVLRDWSGALEASLPPPRWQQLAASGADERCVDVDFFARYPLRAVWPQDGQSAVAQPGADAAKSTPARQGANTDPQAGRSAQVKPGTLNGHYRLEFANGNWLTIEARGDMHLAKNAQGVPVITGRYGLNEYVARVIDREAGAEPPAAARALAIVARSYLVQNGHFEAACWHIQDASSTQRVSPNPPSGGALAASWFTDEMVLSGAQVHFHQSEAAPNQLAWRAAVAQAATQDFDAILQHSFASASLVSMSQQTECTRLTAAENWLHHASRHWQSRLQREPGFETPELPPQICALQEGNPYSDQRRLRIYVRGWQSLNERVTLAHEYLHLALRFHPHGSNEDYIERLARRLIEG